MSKKSIPRLLSLYLPRWPIDRRRLPAETPLILKGSDGRRRVVVAANRAALACGLRIGMPVTQAQALTTGLVVHDADPGGDAEALERLAQWALRTFSPLTAADPPDGLVIDIGGAAHLHGGEPALLEKLIADLSTKGIEARAAVAGSWGTAHALARFGRKAVIVADDAAFLRDLPVEALRLSPEVAARLRLLGFTTIGEVMAQPRAPLVHRFGRELGCRLDQAFGQVEEPVEPVRLPDIIEINRLFAEPIGAAETIARYTGKLTAQLCDKLEARGLGARQLDLLFIRVDNRIEAVRVGMTRPVRDINRLTRLLCDKIETVDPGFGIERMRLIATFAEPLASTQGTMEEDKTADIAGLIDTLSNRIGAEHIYRLTPVESDVPERALKRISPLAEEGQTPPQSFPRPVRLLRRPEPIKPLAQLPDHPPTHVIWRNVRYRVAAADGPERIFGEWWRRGGEITAVRDYFRIELETGQRLWIYRSGDGAHKNTGSQTWFLHGVFA